MATRTITGVLRRPGANELWVSADVVFRLLAPFATAAESYGTQTYTVTTHATTAVLTTVLAAPDEGNGTVRYECTLPDGSAFVFALGYGVGNVPFEGLVSGAYATGAEPGALETHADMIASTSTLGHVSIGDGEGIEIHVDGVIAVETELRLPTLCYCAMSIGVVLPPNQETLMPMQVLGQTAAIHPGGIAGTLTMQAHGLYDFQSVIYTDPVSLDGYYIDVKLRKNEESDNTILGWNRKGGLPTASVVQVVPVSAPAVQMDEGDTMEVYISHNYTGTIAFYVQRLAVVRRGDYS